MSRLPATRSGAAVGQKIKRLALPCRERDRDRLHQPVQAETLILLEQAGDIGLDDLVGLRVQGAARVPIGEDQQRRHRKGEQQHIDQNDTKRLGS